MKNLVTIVSIALFTGFFSCNVNKRDEFFVIGEIKGLSDSTVLVLKNVDDDVVLDTAIVKKQIYFYRQGVQPSGKGGHQKWRQELVAEF